MYDLPGDGTTLISQGVEVALEYLEVVVGVRESVSYTSLEAFHWKWFRSHNVRQIRRILAFVEHLRPRHIAWGYTVNNVVHDVQDRRT